jgi:UDP-2-acetamido-2,6-beta-L-arabino-hexul-4-ose reductase
VMMKNILVTGAAGFLGKNLYAHLQRREDVAVDTFDLGTPESDLQKFAARADVIFHLAGVNRPEKPEEFETGNAGLTQTLVDLMQQSDRKPHVMMSSSIQATLDNPYGQSKRHGEKILERWAKQSGAKLSVFRLTNLFGKWCRPNYNSVTATFCHNIANDLPVQISDPDYVVKLAYIDDVVAAFLKEMEDSPQRDSFLVDPDPIPATTITLGDLVSRIRFFRDMQTTLMIPDMSERFNQQLYATYMSYVPQERWTYFPPVNTDNRGNLAELVKSQSFGQMFVSRTKPGVTRGNHYHHTKIEKFMVISGEAVIRFRHIFGTEVIKFPVKGEDYHIVEIPPGYTHNITNTGDTELITLFWSSEIFNKEQPDTYYLPVEQA